VTARPVNVAETCKLIRAYGADGNTDALIVLDGLLSLCDVADAEACMHSAAEIEAGACPDAAALMGDALAALARLADPGIAGEGY